MIIKRGDKIMTNKTIKIYTLSTCSHCKAAKKFLNDLSVQYDCVDVDLLDAEDKATVLDEVRKYNPKLTFPTILCGDKVIIGFQDREIKDALGL
jgi:glutaredoxin-like protein NrdH